MTTQATPEDFPAVGGAYVRQADGTLHAEAPPTRVREPWDLPEAEEDDASARRRKASPPVKEG